LRLLAARVFHARVTFFRRKVVLEQSQQAGFLTSWILDSSGWIPDSRSWIPDSKVVDSGFHRLKLPGFRIPDNLTWGDLFGDQFLNSRGLYPKKWRKK